MFSLLRKGHVCWRIDFRINSESGQIFMMSCKVNIMLLTDEGGGRDGGKIIFPGNYGCFA